jgi:hypothetical protein
MTNREVTAEVYTVRPIDVPDLFADVDKGDETACRLMQIDRFRIPRWRRKSRR